MNIRIYVFIIVVSGMVGCKSSKFSHRGSTPVRSNIEILEALEDNNILFEWYSYKGDIKVDLEHEQFRGNTQIRMKKDSAIWILVKKLSIEGARVLLTPDDITLINRIERTYSVRNTYWLFDQFSLDLGFRDIQELVIGNVILPPDDNYKVKNEDTSYYLDFFDGQYQIEYKVNAYDLTIEQSRIYIDPDNYIQVNYEDYKKIKGYGEFPYKRILQLIKDGNLTDQIILNAKEITINEPKKMPFQIPARYEEVY